MLIVAVKGRLGPEGRQRVAKQLSIAREQNKIAVLEDCTVAHETAELIRLAQPFGDEVLWVDPNAVASVRKGIAHSYDGPVSAITIRDGDSTSWLVTGRCDAIAARINQARNGQQLLSEDDDD